MSPGVPISSQAAPSVQQHSLFAGSQWFGGILRAPVISLLLFDGITRVMKVSTVLAASARRGLPEDLVVTIGITLLACSIFYVIRSTSILGSAAQSRRLGNPLFRRTLFPVYFGRAGVARTVSP